MEDIEIGTVSPTQPNPSVVIRNAFKRYSPTSVVLNGLNLTVPDRAIYGLLGSSGCGKTTLLNCIVGKTELDAGSIALKVKKRTEIGYMPQALSIHDRMTISENFFFYGFLHGMDVPKIQTQALELISFLELPTADRFVSDLSGGQQRRVSLALALIHDPKIVILDEPTVGLDPILSHSIWKRLLEMAQKGKSIIITTHYIQEARQAHTIGLMREGKLLAEEPPLQLMEKCGCNDLEDAFLMLSRKQEVGVKDDIEAYPKKSHPVKVKYDDDERIFSNQKFRGIMYKNMTLLKREYVFIVFVVVLPILQTYLFNVAIGGRPKNLRIGVVNEEIQVASCDRSAYEGCLLNEEENQNFSFSCLYLDFLRNESYIIVEYPNDAKALEAVKKNKVWGALHFRQNYTLSLANKVSYGRHVSPEDLAYSFVSTWIDLSNQYIGNLVKYDMYRSMVAFLQRIMLDCEMNPKLTTIPIRFEEPIYGAFNESFLRYASSAVLCLCCFFLPMILSAGLLLTEKIGGMMERMMVAGASMTEIISSAVTIQVVVHFIQTVLSMIVMYWWFDNPLKGNMITLCSLMMLTGVFGMFFGFMLAVMNKDMMKSFYIGAGMNLALCMTSGLLWPVEAEHYLLKSISWLLPLTWTADATRAICSKSFSFLHPHVLRGFGSTIVWNLIIVLVMYLFVKYRRDGLVIQN